MWLIPSRGSVYILPLGIYHYPFAWRFLCGLRLAFFAFFVLPALLLFAFFAFFPVEQEPSAGGRFFCSLCGFFGFGLWALPALGSFVFVP